MRYEDKSLRDGVYDSRRNRKFEKFRKLTARFWKSHARNLVMASFEKTFGTFRLPEWGIPSELTDSLPSSFEPHRDDDSSPRDSGFGGDL